MDFKQIVEAVLELTKRPDKRAETEIAVNSAISYYVLRNRFHYDLVETELAIDPNLYEQVVSIAGLIRFRGFDYVKVRGMRSFLTERKADQIFSPANVTNRNSYVQTGTDITILTTQLASFLDVGYYQYPPTLTGTDTHWLCDRLPNCIIDKAAARIFRNTGAAEDARLHEAYAGDAYNIFVNDYHTAKAS